MVFSGTGQTPRRLCSPAYPGRATVTVADSTAAVFEMKVRQVVEGGSVSVGTITSEGGSVSLGSVTAGSCFDLILRHKGPGPATYRVALNVAPLPSHAARDTLMSFSTTGQAERRVCVGLPGSANVTATLLSTNLAAPNLKVRQRVEGGVAVLGALTTAGDSVSVVSVGALAAGSCFDLSFRHPGPGGGTYTVRLDTGS